MNERSLRRLFRRLVLLSLPVPAALVGMNCGGTDEAPSEGFLPAGSMGTSGNGHEDGGPKGGGGAGAANDAGGQAESTLDPSFLGPRCPNGRNSWSVPIPEGFDSGAAEGGTTFFSGAMCAPYCGPAFGLSCEVDESEAGVRDKLICHTDICTGRRPAGLVPETSASAQDLGGYFADMAHLEAASISAFRRLERELAAHRAPRAMIKMARRAIRDERRHARLTRALARQHGGDYRAPRIVRGRRRSLEEMAVENAVEGCVHETFGALLATHQAARAKDRVIRAVMARIADDETRHALLAWKVAGWLSSKLDRAARKRVAAAQRAAATELLGASHGSHPEMARLGLPDAQQGVALVARLFDSMWSSAVTVLP